MAGLCQAHELNLCMSDGRACVLSSTREQVSHCLRKLAMYCLDKAACSDLTTAEQGEESAGQVVSLYQLYKSAAMALADAEIPVPPQHPPSQAYDFRFATGPPV